MLSAETLYTKAYHRLNKTEYEKAAEYFEKVEVEHPYSKWAVKAKLMGAYAHYKAGKYDDALLSLDRFIKYHPGNKDIAMRIICVRFVGMTKFRRRIKTRRQAKMLMMPLMP